jgi:hypothetical protein
MSADDVIEAVIEFVAGQAVEAGTGRRPWHELLDADAAMHLTPHAVHLEPAQACLLAIVAPSDQAGFLDQLDGLRHTLRVDPSADALDAFFERLVEAVTSLSPFAAPRDAR